jgi:hypothetical protein
MLKRLNVFQFNTTLSDNGRALLTIPDTYEDSGHVPVSHGLHDM